MPKAEYPRGKFFSGRLHPGFWVVGISLVTAGIHNSLNITGMHSLAFPLAVGAVLGCFLYAYTKKHRQQLRSLHQTGTEVRKSELKYRTFFENSADAMLMIEEGQFVDCNDATVAMLGYDWKEDLLHTHPSKLSPEFQPDGQPSAEKADEMMRLAMEQGRHRFEWEHQRKDGTVFPVEVSLTAIQNDGGGVHLHTVWRDKTEHMRAEHALRESEEKFRALYDNSPLPYQSLDEKGYFLDVNPAWLEKLGYQREEVLGKRYVDFMHPDWKEHFEETFPGLKERGYQCSVEFELRHKDGHYLDVSVHSRAGYAPDGSFAQTYSVFQDITEQKRAEKELKQAYAFLQEVIDGLPEELMVINRDYTIALANRKARTMAGEDPVAAGLKCHQVSHHCDTPCKDKEHPCPLKEVLKTRLPVTVEHIHTDAEDRETIVELVAAPIFDKAGEVIQIIESCRDVTDRKRAEEALLASMQKLALHVEQTPLGVVGWDLDFRVTEWNPAAERILGYTQEEALGQHAKFIVPPAAHEHIDNIWEQLLAQTGGVRSDNENLTKDGRTIVCEWYNTPLVDAQNQVVGVASLLMDITDRKQAEEAREELELQLRQAQKMEAVGQMAGGIAHDFNNLLQIIGGYAERSQATVSPENPVAASLQEIDNAAERGKTLVSQLLAFSRRQVIRPVDLNLNKVIEPLLNMIRGLIGEHIKLEIIPGHGLGIVHADRGLMEQVLMNLCVNARDAMPQGGTLTIETENVLTDSEYAQTHSWATEGRCILLSVSDTGCGMDKETLERIFEPFFTTKEVGKGTGLGLSMVYGIITQHEGHIVAHSEPGKGATFEICLPAVENRAAEAPNVVSGPVSGGTETLLVAEDDEAVLNLLERTLHEAGYTVLTAKDGKEAVREFKEHADEIDMLMFDVVMPRAGGKEATEEIFKTHPDLPHLFVSGYSENVVHTNFIQDRGLHLLSKPYQTETLLRKIREVLDFAPE